MNADKLVSVLALIGFVGTFLFAVICGIYIIVIELLKILKRRGNPEPLLRVPESPRNLRAAYLFFTFIGGVAVFAGAYTWIYQPPDRQQAILTFISAVFFFAWAFVAYKKV